MQVVDRLYFSGVCNGNDEVLKVNGRNMLLHAGVVC